MVKLRFTKESNELKSSYVIRCIQCDFLAFNDKP